MPTASPPSSSSWRRTTRPRSTEASRWSTMATSPAEVAVTWSPIPEGSGDLLAHQTARKATHAPPLGLGRQLEELDLAVGALLVLHEVRPGRDHVRPRSGALVTLEPARDHRGVAPTEPGPDLRVRLDVLDPHRFLVHA